MCYDSDPGDRSHRHGTISKKGLMIQSLHMSSCFSNTNEHDHLGNSEMRSDTMSTNDIEDNTISEEQTLQSSVCCYSELDCSKRKEEEEVIVSEDSSGGIVRAPILSLLSLLSFLVESIMKALLVVDKFYLDDFIEDHVVSMNLEVLQYSSVKSKV